MIDNPYWDLIKDMVHPSHYEWEGPQIGSVEPYIERGPVEGWAQDFEDGVLLRPKATRKYSWSVTDPDSIAFVVAHAKGRIIDPMAGTGYWCYVLGQSGVDCVAYDLNPPKHDTAENHWHKNASLFVPVTKADAADAVLAADPDRTLFLSWPPFDDSSASVVLDAYSGNRLIYIGEDKNGCTGDADFHETLKKEWALVDLHLIVQYEGIHDLIWVYDRNQ